MQPKRRQTFVSRFPLVMMAFYRRTAKSAIDGMAVVAWARQNYRPDLDRPAFVRGRYSVALDRQPAPNPGGILIEWNDLTIDAR
jgi:hypothetical protein